MPPIAKAPPKPAADFSLVSFVRSQLADADLLPGEGSSEMRQVADAGRVEAAASGRLIRGHVLPLQSTRAEAGGLNTSSFSAGGALVHSGIALVDALQPVLQLERLGARRVTSRSGDLVISAPATVGGGWVVEDDNIPADKALFAACMAQPAEAGARIKMSRRLFKQAGTVAEQEFRGLVQRSLAETIEKGILTGTGNNGEPMGLVNDEQLQRETYTAASGSLPSAAKVAELAGDLLDAGADLDALAILAAGEDYADSQQPTTGTDAPLVNINDGRRRMAGIPVAFSPYMPTGNIIIADWSRVLISYVGAPQLIINPYTYSESGLLELSLFQMVSYAVERRNLLTVATLTGA